MFLWSSNDLFHNHETSNGPLPDRSFLAIDPPEEVVQLISIVSAMVYEHKITLPLGESSLSEERANTVCQWPVVTDAINALPGRSNVRPSRREGIASSYKLTT